MFRYLILASMDDDRTCVTAAPVLHSRALWRYGDVSEVATTHQRGGEPEIQPYSPNACVRNDTRASSPAHVLANPSMSGDVADVERRLATSTICPRPKDGYGYREATYASDNSTGHVRAHML